MTAAGLAELTRQWMNALSGRELAIEAITDLLLRQVDPDKLYESDLISVWSSASSDGAPRYGLLEFDISKLAEVKIDHAHLELGTVDRRPVRQQAALIPPGIAGATWNTYQAERAAMVEPLNTLGSFDLPQGSQSGGYVASHTGSESVSPPGPRSSTFAWASANVGGGGGAAVAAPRSATTRNRSRLIGKNTSTPRSLQNTLTSSVASGPSR